MKKIEEFYQLTINFLPQLVAGIIVLLLSTLVSLFIKKYLLSKLKNKTKNPLLISFIGKMASLSINIFGVIMFLSIIGLGNISSKLLAGAGIMTFVVGFAFKDIGENFLSGILLAFKSPFGVNDLIETESIVGYVSEVNLSDTIIKTLDGKDVFIPNSQIVKNPLINYTVDGYLRYDFVVGIDYDCDIDKAILIIENTLKGFDEILTSKTPVVIVHELMPSTINIKAFYWIDTFSSKSKSYHNTIRSKIITQVLKNLVAEKFYLPGDILEIKNHNQNNFLVSK